jgi:hypothetical protein
VGLPAEAIAAELAAWLRGAAPGQPAVLVSDGGEFGQWVQVGAQLPLRASCLPSPCAVNAAGLRPRVVAAFHTCEMPQRSDTIPRLNFRQLLSAGRVQACVPAGAYTDRVINGPSGSIGGVLPFALAAALARPVLTRAPFPHTTLAQPSIMIREQVVRQGDTASSAVCTTGWVQPERLRASGWQSEKDAKLAQKLGQLQPFIAVLPLECMGQLASFGPT